MARREDPATTGMRGPLVDTTVENSHSHIAWREEARSWPVRTARSNA
jgi:hypothetical protein